MALGILSALLACVLLAPSPVSAQHYRDDQDPGRWNNHQDAGGEGRPGRGAPGAGDGDSSAGGETGDGGSNSGGNAGESGNSGGGGGRRRAVGEPPAGDPGDGGTPGDSGGSTGTGNSGGGSNGGSNGRDGDPATGGPTDGNPSDGNPPEETPPAGRGGGSTGDGSKGGGSTGDGSKGDASNGGGTKDPQGGAPKPPHDDGRGSAPRDVAAPMVGFSGVLGGRNSDPAAEAREAAARQAAAAEEARFFRSKVENFRPEQASSDPLVRAAALIHSAKTKLDMGDRTEAIRDATAALELAPGAPAALSLRATALNLAGRHEEAARDAREALKAKPEEQALWENLAWSNLRAGQYADAIHAAEMALKLNPKSALALATRGYARQMLGDMAGLRADLEAAAALDSRFADKAALARAGKRAYDPNGDDASYLLGAAAAVAAGAAKLWPAALSLMLFGCAAVFIAFVASRRRSSAVPPQLEPLAPARAPVNKGLLAGKYRMEGLVGRGGMGEVRRAKDVTLGRPVAIKTLVSALGSGPEGAAWRERLRKEAMTVAAVHHPGIVDIYEIVEEDGALHLVFEYLEGITAASMLAQSRSLTPAHCARLLSPVCDALSHAHAQGLVHRDLKPGNIMVTATGHVKLLDFGIARAQGERVAAGAGAGPSGPRFDRTTTVAGTPVYMAPEADDGMVGPAGDVYSLGVCLYELLTARRPFPDTATMLEKSQLRAAPPSELVPGVPPALDRLVASAMSWDPAARPASAEAFKAALNDAVRP